MNKLLLVEDIKDGDYELNYQKNTILNITNKVNLNDYNNNYNLKINIDNKSILNIDKVSLINKDLNVIINIKDDTIFNLNWVIINTGKNKVHLEVNMTGNNSNAKARVRIINKTNDSNLDFVINGVIAKKTYDNELLEDIKGLIIGNDTIKISPNMDVFTSEVMANHFVTIGTIPSSDLFYLESKGLSQARAEQLILEGFLKEIWK